MVEYNTLDFFGYNEDQKKVLALLKEANKPKSKSKLCLMTAPSFVVDFDFKNFVLLMKGLGFDKVTELTFGAKIVNENYHRFIREHYTSYVSGGKKNDAIFKSVFIASVCPSVVSLVKNSFPHLKKYLLPFVSPMGAMAKIVRKNFPKHKIVFLSPCSAKKFEAREFGNYKGKPFIDAVITFAEMKQIVAKEKPTIKKGSGNFDSFYNDYTKVYPLLGGLSSTLHYKGILYKGEMASCDGAKKLAKLFSKKSDKTFFDVLFCKGGCIGGPGAASGSPLLFKKSRVVKYSHHSNKNKGNKQAGLDKYTKGLDFSKEF
ncbi:MAG: hypothetical protein NTY48_02210 [Candidatus Diapherotrites archaeon]|nr:hypothetical protein [Candidatus Diapherotrites archaeon]